MKSVIALTALPVTALAQASWAITGLKLLNIQHTDTSDISFTLTPSPGGPPVTCSDRNTVKGYGVLTNVTNVACSDANFSFDFAEFKVVTYPPTGANLTVHSANPPQTGTYSIDDIWLERCQDVRYCAACQSIRYYGEADVIIVAEDM